MITQNYETGVRNSELSYHAPKGSYMQVEDYMSAQPPVMRRPSYQSMRTYEHGQGYNTLARRAIKSFISGQNYANLN